MIHVWAVPIQRSASVITELVALLSPDEQTRAAKFRFDPLRQSFIFTRGMLRVLLGRYLELAPEQIIFHYSERGKPSVDFETPIRFNVSHSGELVLFAFARDCDLGVDVEQIRALGDMDAIAHCFFCSEEFTQYTSIPPAEREGSFFRCWTRKEAYLKATGNGLWTQLNSFCVTLDPLQPASVVHIEGDREAAQGWTLHDLALSGQYAATVAYRDARRPLRMLSLDTVSDLRDVV